MPEQTQLAALAKLKDEYCSLSEPEQFGVVVSDYFIFKITLACIIQFCVLKEMLE